MAKQDDKSFSVQEKVFLALRKKIMDLTLRPGTVMSANEVSVMMSVSRTPVREAFIRLEREGLVRIVPQSETIVSRINLRRVRQEHFLRESLELAALEPFFRKCSREHLDKLRKIIRRQYEHAEKKDYAAVVDYDDTFHRLIFTVAEQPLSWEIIESMSGHYRRCRLMTMWSDELKADVMLQHEALVDAVQEGDMALVRRVMEKHLRKIFVEEGVLLTEYPDYFEANERDPFDVI